MEVVDELSVMTYVSMLYKRMTKQSRSGKCWVFTSHQILIWFLYLRPAVFSKDQVSADTRKRGKQIRFFC